MGVATKYRSSFFEVLPWLGWLAVIWCLTPTLPIFDEWPVIGAQLLAPWSWGAALAPLNEHRLPLLREIIHLNGFGGASQLRLMTLSALACGAAFLIARRHFRASTPATLILASVAWFSFSQWEAQFMGLVLHWYLYALGLALIASALKPLNLPRVVVGLLICASTLGAWLLLPPLVMAFILGGDQPRRPKLASCGAVIVSALVIGFWVPRVRSHSTLNVFRHIARSPGAFVDYALAYLGGPLFFVLKDVTLCIGAGVLWIALFLIAWLKFDLRKNPLVGFIGAHQVLFALALASGRMNLGVWQGTASRYLALSLPAWVLLLWHLSERVSFRKWGLVLLGFLAFTSARGLGYYVKRKVPDRRAGLECYRELKATGEWNRSDKDACLTKVSNSASEFREIARQLNREF